jgi:hypothetical protein
MAKSIKYSIEDYNAHDVLKISFNLSLVAAYLLKYFYIMFLLPVFSKVPGLSESVTLAMPFVNKFVEQPANLIFLISSLPVVLVTLAMFRRVPQTKSPLLRWAWTQGRPLLLFSAIIDIALMLLYLLLGIRHLNEMYILLLYLDGMCIVYLWKSTYVIDAFAQFPEYKKGA